jgi:LPS export ABC transporter protein LptC
MGTHMTLFRTNLLKPTIPFLLLGLLQCVGAPPPSSAVDENLKSIQADYVIFGLTDYLTRGGVREALVQADTAYFYRDSTVVILRGNVHLLAYDKDLGTERAQVSSDRGRLNTINNSMVARGNAILLIEKDGRRIESSELSYYPALDVISSDSITVMHEGDMIVEGTGFDSDLDFLNVRIRNGKTRGGVIR